MPETVSFHRMDEGAEEDYALLHHQKRNFIAALPTKSLDYFIPMIYKVFSRPAFSLDVAKSDTVWMT